MSTFMLQWILVSFVLIRVEGNLTTQITELNLSMLIYFYMNCVTEFIMPSLNQQEVNV